jgi:hypothetical protein
VPAKLPGTPSSPGPAADLGRAGADDTPERSACRADGTAAGLPELLQDPPHSSSDSPLEPLAEPDAASPEDVSDPVGELTKPPHETVPESVRELDEPPPEAVPNRADTASLELPDVPVQPEREPPPGSDAPQLGAYEPAASLAPAEEIVIPETRLPWAALGGAAFVALGLGVTLVWASGHSSGEPSNASARAAQAAAEQQPATPPSAAKVAPAAAETKPPLPQQQPTPDEPTEARTGAALSQQQPTPGKPTEARPDVNGRAIEYRVAAALLEAKNCHRGGRATGTARVVMTLEPTGTVSETRLVGEPLASAPVGNCIRTVMNGVVVPKFDGAPITIDREITLR